MASLLHFLLWFFWKQNIFIIFWKYACKCTSKSPQNISILSNQYFPMRSFFFGKKTYYGFEFASFCPATWSSATQRIPWGKRPVPTRSLGTERWFSSGRYFYLDSSSSIKHLGGRALTLVSVAVLLHSRDKAVRHSFSTHWEVEYSKGITPPGDMPRVSRKACSRLYSSLPVLCHSSGTSICEMASGLWQLPHLPTAMWVHIFWKGFLSGEACVLAVHGSVQWWTKAGDVAEMICAPTSQQLPNPSCSPLAVLSFKVFWLDTVSLCIPTAKVQCLMAVWGFCAVPWCQKEQQPCNPHCQASPNGLESSRSGWQQTSPAPLSLSPLWWGRTSHPWRLLLDKALASQTQCRLRAHTEWEARLQISRGPFQPAFLWSCCLLTPGPIQSKCSCKASLDTHCCFCHSPIWFGYLQMGFQPSWVPPLKKLLLLEFHRNIRLNHTLRRCFWSCYPLNQSWILTFLIC